MSNQIETIIRESMSVKNKILEDPKIINIIGKALKIPTLKFLMEEILLIKVFIQ